MALRMNLHGVDLQAIENAFGSNDDQIVASASTLLADMLSKEKARGQATGWLRTLVQTGRPERAAPLMPDDGGLHVYLAESETHVFALHALVKAVSGDGLDLSDESSEYHYDAFPVLINDMRACRFSTSETCSRGFLAAYSELYRGTPMFGHKFETDWSFYSILPRDQINDLTDGLEAAKRYERQVAAETAPEVRANVRTRISEAGIQFIDELQGWFRRIQDADLDAYVIWW